MKLLCEVFPVYAHWHIRLCWETNEMRGVKLVRDPVCFVTGIRNEETAHRIARALQAEFGELPS